MTVKIIAAFLIAFLVSVLFGKHNVSWLEKREIRQPLKDEVAKIYDQAEGTENDKSSETL